MGSGNGNGMMDGSGHGKGGDANPLTVLLTYFSIMGAFAVITGYIEMLINRVRRGRRTVHRSRAAATVLRHMRHQRPVRMQRMPGMLRPTPRHLRLFRTAQVRRSRTAERIKPNSRRAKRVQRKTPDSALPGVFVRERESLRWSFVHARLTRLPSPSWPWRLSAAPAASCGWRRRTESRS